MHTHTYLYQCRAILVDVVAPEIEADVSKPLTPNAFHAAPGSFNRRGSLSSEATQFKNEKSGTDPQPHTHTPTSYYPQPTTHNPRPHLHIAILGDNVDSHITRFWLGTCKWWPFAPNKNGEDEWGYEYMLGLVRKCLLLNSIYVTGAGF
jgi:hypothetical protein